MKKSILAAACALMASTLLGVFGTSAKAAPKQPPTNLQLLDQLIAQSKDGTTAMQDDMVLNLSQLRSLRAKMAGSGRITRSAFYQTTYWTGGRVFYNLDASLPAAQQTAFVEAAREWEKWANLKFAPRTTEANYINVIQDGDGSNSAVGMVGGQQTMRLASWANKMTACHELAHALGVMHEQSRSDRGNYVTIDFSNVQAGQEHNFALIGDSRNFGAYDFDSVMHYPGVSFAIDSNKPTIVCKPAYASFQNTMGQRSFLTELDKAGMAIIYGFPPGVTATPVPTPTLPPRPTLAADQVIVKEGDSGTTPMTFHVKLTQVPTKDVTFSYKIERDHPTGLSEADLDLYSANPVDDFEPIEGTITLPAATTDNNGNSTKEADISVSIIGDTRIENDESLVLTLSDPVNARFMNEASTLTVKGIIQNDDFAATATPVPTIKPTAKPTATPKPTAQPTATPKPTAKPTATPAPTPSVRITLSPSAPKYNSVVKATVVLTPSTNTTLSSTWRFNGAVVARNVLQYNLSTRTGVKKGDVVKIEAIPSRGSVRGTLVTASVTVANTAPVAKSTTSTTLSAVPVTVPLSATDVDGDSLSYAIVAKPVNGTATLTQTGGKWTITYRSKVGFIGTEAIGFVATDGTAKSVGATAQVEVKANTSPALGVVTPTEKSFAAGTPVTFQQTVSDAENNLTAVRLLLSNSSGSADSRNGVDVVYNPTTKTVSLGSGNTTQTIPVGSTLESTQGKVTLLSVSQSGSKLTLNWQITPKATWTGTKTFWARAEDAGTLLDGFTQSGQVTFTGSTGTATQSAGNS